MSDCKLYRNADRESLLQEATRAKQSDRQRRLDLPPQVAQRIAEQVFDPLRWHIADDPLVRWPGDLGDAVVRSSWLDY